MVARLRRYVSGGYSGGGRRRCGWLQVRAVVFVWIDVLEALRIGGSAAEGPMGLVSLREDGHTQDLGLLTSLSLFNDFESHGCFFLIASSGSAGYVWVLDWQQVRCCD